MSVELCKCVKKALDHHTRKFDLKPIKLLHINSILFSQLLLFFSHLDILYLKTILKKIGGILTYVYNSRLF